MVGHSEVDRGLSEIAFDDALSAELHEYEVLACNIGQENRRLCAKWLGTPKAACLDVIIQDPGA